MIPLELADFCNMYKRGFQIRELLGEFFQSQRTNLFQGAASITARAKNFDIQHDQPFELSLVSSIRIPFFSHSMHKSPLRFVQ